MAQNMNNGDLVNLDEATRTPLESGVGASGGDTVIQAAEIFQQQLDQMTAWKTQLSQQMDAMQRDAVKLLERQKHIAQEKSRLAEEHAQIAGEHAQLQQQQTQLAAEGQKLAQQAAELSEGQTRLAAAEQQRELAVRELAAREKEMTGQESRHRAESVRLREGMEQLEEQRRQLAHAQHETAQQQEKLVAEARDLATRAESLDQREQSLAARERELAGAKAQLEQAQAELRAKEAALAAQEQALAEQLRTTEAQLESRAAALAAGEKQHAAERDAIARTRHDIQKRVEVFEQEQAEQLEALAKQTKRLADRRSAVEAAENDLETALGNRIAQATETLTQQLAQAQGAAGGAQERVAQLEQQHAQLEQQLAQLQQQLAQDQSAAQSWQGLKAQLKTKIEELQKSKEDLEFQLELAREDHAKQLEALRQQLTAEITQRDTQIAAWQEKYTATRGVAEAAAAASASASGNGDQVPELAPQVQMFQQQRDDLAAQLFAVQDALKKQQQEALLTQNGLEARLLEQQQKNTALEAEKSSWQKPDAAAASGATATASDHGPQAGWHRQRLLTQAKALRMLRHQIGETQTAQAAGRVELAQQREQLRARKENLEQVKRLLEKQEMVMARKLADHNAVKTVAAVGIFVIMVLGSVFFSVYRFVRPVYRSEAVVQLAAPQELAATDLDAWLRQQMEFTRSSDVTYAAWKILRGEDEHYAMHDVRDEWLATLPSHLHLTLDSGSKTLAVQYSGPEAHGVSQVCNALATAYANPGMRDPGAAESNRALGAGAQLLAKATAPLYPLEDNRMMICMCLVAVVLFVSLILVMIFRHFIARQLREIDQMADAEDLQSAQSDLPDTPQPAVK
jgi:chromosome segregation ATPase